MLQGGVRFKKPCCRKKADGMKAYEILSHALRGKVKAWDEFKISSRAILL
jgi:hypothetical protein